MGEHKLANKKTPWERERDSLKTRWVLSTIAFWVSAIVQVVIYFLKGDLNYVLLSIIFGMLVLGVVLKARWQLHLKKEPTD